MAAPMVACAGAAASSQRLRVADVVRGFLGVLHNEHALTQRQDEVLERIARCQTAAMGGHVMVCARCGERIPMYNSCRDRHCPQCQWGAQLKWIEARRERILPVPYFHTVFTLPESLRPILKANPRAMYALLFEAASRTLQLCAANSKWLGAMPGFTLVLHTWDRKLGYHPHIHGVVTAGGLDPKGHWKGTGRPGRKSFLFPVRAMAKLLRGIFLQGLIAALTRGELCVPDTIAHDILDRLRAAARIQWHVYAKRPFAGAEQVYAYLGRYTHRIGISNSRMIAIDGDLVRFHTKGGKQERIPGVEFLRRLAQHLLPKGFTRIRHYGLLAAAHVNTSWQTAYDQLTPSQAAPPAPQTDPDDEPDTPPTCHPPICPRCGAPALVHVPQAALQSFDTS